MNNNSSFADFADWQPSGSSRQSSVSQHSESSGLTLSTFTTPSTTRFSQTASEIELQRPFANTSTLELHPSVGVSFVKGSRLFKLKFTHINVCKDLHGNLRCIELGEGPAATGTASFIHTFPHSRLPIPHIEQPITSSKAQLHVVSFLDEQTVQTAQTLFTAQPHYTFDDREDWIRFQETLLDQQIVFVAGIAEASSKGRGEECISQNLRILRSKTGKQTILLFTNSQRKEKKRYMVIPLDCIDQIDPPKKNGRPVSLRLRPNLELLAQLKGLHIQFLDDNDQKAFSSIVSQAIGAGAK